MNHSFYISCYPSKAQQDISKSLFNDGVGTPSVLSRSKRSIEIGKKPRRPWQAKRSERKFF